MVTRNIADCNSITELYDIYNEWGGSFDYIHAAAALVKCGKLQGGARSSLVDKLCSTWHTQLPMSGVQGCANVLWACVTLGPGAVQRLWGPTWEAYTQQLQRQGSVSGVGGGCNPQSLTNPLWACAKLRKQPSLDELQLLMQTYLQSSVMTTATPQNVANVVWALGELCQLSSWQGCVSEQEVQQLLGKQQLQLLAASGSKQDTTNVLLGLARMATATAPVISVDFARLRSKQLLALADKRVSSWGSQQVANALWSCGELGLVDTPFIAAAVAAAPSWLPASNIFDISQAALACAALPYPDERFVRALLHQAEVLLSQQQHGKWPTGSRPGTSSTGYHASTGIAACCYATARLDMAQCAESAKSLVVSSGFDAQQRCHPAELRRLWVFHTWLVENQLCDGQGLAGVLSQKQLQMGAKEEDTYEGH
jgi:hypothetical protein